MKPDAALVARLLHNGEVVVLCDVDTGRVRAELEEHVLEGLSLATIPMLKQVVVWSPLRRHAICPGALSTLERVQAVRAERDVHSAVVRAWQTSLRHIPVLGAMLLPDKYANGIAA